MNVRHPQDAVRGMFVQAFGGSPRIYRAPGRVNLIGEHTDYNQGFVMPAAIDRYCWIAIASRKDRFLRIHSSNFEHAVTADLAADPRPRADWSDYVVGTARALELRGARLRGADIFIYGEVPLGSGLSSSAAIEVSTGYALLDVSEIAVDRTELAIACRAAENEFVGARVGIMDQYIAAHGRVGHALMIDCRSLQAVPLPLPINIRLAVCNTGVKHALASGEYNVRRAQCEEALLRLARALPGIQALRDVTLEELEEHRGVLPEILYRRARHVVTENERVECAAKAMQSSDLEALGHRMRESHRSLRDDYEVSCLELDTMVDICSAQPGVIGSRMTGGGFGGCTVSLLEAEAADAFLQSVGPAYQERTHIKPEIYIVEAADGVGRVE
jgi:galactokinase